MPRHPQRPGKSGEPVSDQEYLEKVTGREELARHREQLERQEERQHREHRPVMPAEPRSAAPPVAPGRRAPVMLAGPPAADHLSEAERAEGGVMSPPLPGGRAHVDAGAVRPHGVAAKDHQPYYSGIMAHGVPDAYHPERGVNERAREAERRAHETEVLHSHRVPAEPDPVPVYIVERAAGGKARLDTATVNRTAPVSGSDPVRLTGQDLRRTRVGLLNENSSHHARVSKSLADLAQGKGILLPGGATSYLWLNTQDDLFAVSNDSTAVALSVILEYELPGAG